MKHRIRQRWYLRTLKMLFKHTWGYTIALALIALIMHIGGKQVQSEVNEVTCRTQIRQALEAKNSSWLSKCQIFVSYHGFNNISEKQDIFRIYRKNGQHN